MSYPIEKRLLNLKQSKLIDSRIIVAHESGNTRNTGKNALENEVAFMARQALKGGSYVSHWVGGGGKIIQLSKTGFVQYGAGANANAYSYAQVELARTSDATVFKKDYLAYVWLLKSLAYEAHIPRTLNTGRTVKEKGIKTHHWISANLGGTTHRDPDDYLSSFGISLKKFEKDLKEPLDLQIKNPIEPIEIKNIHIVKYGDTLWSIAKKYRTTVTWLKKLNHLSTDQINIGTILVLTTKQTNGPSFQYSMIERKEIIKTIQKNCGTIVDGIFGPITKKAILCLFQESIHVPIDGLWGPKTKNSVKTIQFGEKGKNVYAIQAILFSFGYEITGIPDQLFGNKTKQAVQLFQKDHNLVSHGSVGIHTLSLLFG
ncbi:peptidoglycan-binding protein [Carnobacterium sp.]|uniref:peptidoglycan-binding protein n=1 Tax=Carnobacterium sp. TaxID=48221 RepID=UPI003C71F91F